MIYNSELKLKQDICNVPCADELVSEFPQGSVPDTQPQTWLKFQKDPLQIPYGDTNIISYLSFMIKLYKLY